MAFWNRKGTSRARRWNRYTDRIRAAMLRANYEATALGAALIEPEHLLAGLLFEGSGVGMTLLRFSGLSNSEVRNPFDATVQKQIHKLPMSSALKRLFETAAEEAIGLGDDYVGTEHAVLALAGMHDGSLHEQMGNSTGSGVE